MIGSSFVQHCRRHCRLVELGGMCAMTSDNQFSNRGRLVKGSVYIWSGYYYEYSCKCDASV